MPTRDGALSRAATFFDNGGFKSLLTDLVAIPSTAQEEGRGPCCSMAMATRCAASRTSGAPASIRGG